MYTNRKQKKFNALTIRFDDDIFEKINSFAMKDGGERAVLLRQIIEDFFSANENYSAKLVDQNRIRYAH